MKVGVIGAGYWGRKHVDEYVRLLGADAVAVADPSKAARDAAAGNFGVKHLFDDYKALLASDVEAVSVCVDNTLHHKVASEAVRAGKHVLVEKPLTLDVATSQELVRLAGASGRTLAVGHIYRFNNSIRKLKELVGQGYFGDLYALLSRWTTRERQSPLRDITFDVAPHAFDIMHFTTGEWPLRVTATGQAFRRPQLEEMAFITAEMPSGRLTHFEISWLLPGKVRTVEAIGSQRCARIDCLEQTGKVDEWGVTTDLAIARNNTLGDELAHFVECARTGKVPLNSGEVGLATVRCLQATVQSLRERRTVAVDGMR